MATVSNPRNVSVFKKLGVNTAISATYTIAKIIEQASTIENLVNSLSIEQENIVLSELLLTGKCAVVNKKLKELSLPKKRYHLLYPAQCGYDRTKWRNRAAGA